MNILKDIFDISFERGASESFLVVAPSTMKEVYSYQVEMILRNPVKGILQLHARQKNGKDYFYYNITSKIDLKQFLSRNKLGRAEFICILASMVKTILESENYLLNDTGFLIDKEYIYIDPADMNVYLAYMPVELENDINISLKEFVIDLIMRSAEIDAGLDGGDAFVQKILHCVKSETFNIKEFAVLLDSLMAQGTKVFEEIPATPKDAPQKPVEKATGIIKKPWILIIVLQAALISLFAAAVNAGLSLRLGGDPLLTYVGIGIMLLAIDFFMLNRLLKDNGTDKRQTAECYTPRPRTPSRLSEETCELSSQALPCPCLKSCVGAPTEEILITKNEFVLGRLSGRVDYAMRDSAIGKIHAEIITRNGEYFIRDLNSRNGTFVNGQKLISNSDYKICPNDLISFANSNYVFIML